MLSLDVGLKSGGADFGGNNAYGIVSFVARTNQIVES
jgi:hypothetical protein